MLQDPSVMSAALCALQEAILRDPKPYKNLIPSFVSILKQVSPCMRITLTSVPSTCSYT